ncbi:MULTISPECIES: DUF4097 family beta strand repeat-containing protein [unclassified Paenibacillus]|uniref:DUF4097 family beta strand repeat-containing protein n=1 Tax=unclassified Paenibacillus TaxID=185978 RepID=UPI0004148C61|nr:MULTISPECIES: DUF4097 family beta strand repeat-containing protein [unclassified Paenibacillus]
MKPNGHKICKEWLSEDPIQALSLEWMQGEVHISQGTEAVIRVTQRGSALFPRTRCFEAKISNGVLHLIDGRKQAFPVGINFHRTSLHIVLPPTVLQRLLINGVGSRFVVDNVSSEHWDCQCTSGNLTLSGHAQHIRLQSVGGRVTATDLRANHIQLKATSSPIQLSGQFSHIQSRVTGSKLSINSSTMLLSLDSRSTGCNVEVRIPPDKDGFKLDFKQAGGRFSSDFPLHSNHNQHTYRNGMYPFQAEVRGGKLTIGSYLLHTT